MGCGYCELFYLKQPSQMFLCYFRLLVLLCFYSFILVVLFVLMFVNFVQNTARLPASFTRRFYDEIPNRAKLRDPIGTKHDIVVDKAEGR